MLAAPATILSAAVTILAVLVLLGFGIRVSRVRGRTGIAAPAMSGNAEFERANRVHANSLEQFIATLPLLWIATLYFHVVGWLPPILGLVWVVGRLIYSSEYMADPAKRGTGFVIGGLGTLGLLLLSVWGVIASWIAANAV